RSPPPSRTTTRTSKSDFQESISARPTQRAPLTLVRRTGGCLCRAEDALRPGARDIVGGGTRCLIVVEEARLGFRHGSIRETPDHDGLLSARASRDLQMVAGVHHPVRLSRLTVHIHLAALAGALCVGPCLEETGHVQPDVEPHLM